ncbi:MAG: dihydropteroate synthase [Bacteroidaceae bacterium]|nr:dihydropteroate synthase [Bacteroidaceae bacterium]
MIRCVPYTINVGGQLLDLSTPCVMGILNMTPDSFYTSVSPDSSSLDDIIVAHVGRMLSEGAKIIDVGACSTRPGSEPVSAEAERERLAPALDIIRRTFPDCILSVDTFRSDIAEWCINTYGVQIINDISGGCDDMFDVVAKYGTPYILTFNEERNPSIDICQQELLFFSDKVQQLRDRGAKDIILDPGFGFNKTLEENYELLNHLDALLLLELPVLVGVSHKSMIYRLLNLPPSECLNGTTVLHTLSLAKGASILRVHEVKEAMQCITLTHKAN